MHNVALTYQERITLIWQYEIKVRFITLILFSD